MPGKKIEISDDCLMKQLKLKSYRAFEVVFNRYYAGLYRFALAYLMNRELAEDVVQEVFCSLDCLMKQLKLKSYRAFEVVFNRYYAGLYRFALAYLMNRELAEDVVQEVFCSLWTSSLSIPESTHLKSYLYASVKHACLDYFKHLQVIDINQDKLTEALIFSGTIEYEDNEDLLEKVKACLDKLPEQQRRVLELKVFRDMSYREIAETLNISELTVHTHIKRAYKFIRSSLPLLYCFLKYWEQL